MKKMILSLSILSYSFLIITLLPTPSDAKITVTISFTPTGGTTQVLKTFSVDPAATDGPTRCVSLVTFASVSCTATGSGSVTLKLPSNNTNVVTIANIGTTVARIQKTDGSSVDKLEIKGAVITSLAAGRLVIDATTSCGISCEYITPLNLTGGSFPYPVAFSGSFQQSATSALPPASCNTTTFCLQYKLLANTVSVNSIGPTTLATVSVPPFNPAGSINFSTSDTANVMCPQPSGSGICSDQLEIVLTAVFDKAGEVFRLPGSASAFGGNITAENGGISYVNQECAGCVPTSNGFLAYGVGADFVATCSGGQCNKISSKANPSSWQLVWELSTLQNPVPSPIQLVAVDPSLTSTTCTSSTSNSGGTTLPCTPGLSAASSQPTSRAFLMFLPPPGSLVLDDNLTAIQFDNSSVTTGTTAPCTAPDTPLGCGLQVDGLFIDNLAPYGVPDPVTFGDCANGSLFALVRVIDPKGPKGPTPGYIKIYYGTNPPFFQTVCTLPANTNVVSLTESRAEVNLNTGPGGTGPLTCNVPGMQTTTTVCFSWSQAVNKFSKNTVVQSISLEADATVAATSHLVTINSATIASQAGPCSGSSPCVFTPTQGKSEPVTCDALGNAPDPARVRIRVTKVGGATNLGATQLFDDVVLNGSSCNYQFRFTPTGNLSPSDASNVYEAVFMLDGIAKPYPGFLTINSNP